MAYHRAQIDVHILIGGTELLACLKNLTYRVNCDDRAHNSQHTKRNILCIEPRHKSLLKPTLK